MAVAVRADAQSTEASSTSCVVPKPTGLSVGDLMVAHITARTDVTVTNPASWTTIRSETISGVLTSHLAWKIADSGDTAASNFTFTLSGTAVNLGSITAFTGHHTSSPIGANNGTATASNSTTCSSAAITPAVADSMICFFATMGGSNGDAQIGSYTIATSSPTFVEQYEAYTELGNDITYSMACGLRTATTSTGTGTATLEISRNNIGQMIAISPAAAGTTISVPLGQIQVAKLTPSIVVTTNAVIAVPKGSIEVNAKTPTIKLNTIILVPKGEITVAPQTPSISATANQFISVPRGQIQVTALTPSVLTTSNAVIAVPKGSINVQAYVPSVVVDQDIFIPIPLGQITVTPQTPTVIASDHKSIAIPLGQVQVAKYTPTVILNTNINIPLASILVNGFIPTIETTGSKVIEIPLKQILVQAYTPSIVIPSDSGTLTLLGIGS